MEFFLLLRGKNKRLQPDDRQNRLEISETFSEWLIQSVLSPIIVFEGSYYCIDETVRKGLKNFFLIINICNGIDHGCDFLFAY
jgi:hypothetical protein